jgi:hypothetical protein
MRLLVGVLLAATASMTPTAVIEGFELWLHERMVRAALRPGLDVTEEALDTIVRANRASDLQQGDAFRHFDSAPNTVSICLLWVAGIDRWLNEIVDFVEPAGAEKRVLKNREEALKRFGEVTHAIEDFFSHSNYVELGLSSPPRGFLTASCRPQDLHPDIQTGYFDALYADNPHKGCPTRQTLKGRVPVPPSPFRFCHSQINKDSPDRPNHATAVDYATEATKDAWEELHRRIIAKYGSDETIDAECLFTKLGWGKDRSCHRMWVLEGKHTLRRPGPAPEWVGDVVSDGVKIHLEWTPTRYLGPLEPVSAPVQVEYRFNGRVIATFTNPQCKGEVNIARAEGGVWGTLKVTPDPEAVELRGWLGAGYFSGDEIKLTCSSRFGNFGATTPIASRCMGRQLTSLVLKQDENERTFQCSAPFFAELFTGKMKLDRPSP